MKKQPVTKRHALTIDDFIPVIPWTQIEDKFYQAYGKRGGKEWDKFCDYMNGQTQMEGGVFPCDLKRFLSGNRDLVD
jgi:hypothetical protein